MSNSAEAEFNAATSKVGWDYESQLEVLLEYVENQSSPEAFADYLAEKVEATNQPGPSK